MSREVRAQGTKRGLLMRQPIWLLNLSILVLLIAALVFVAFYKIKIPAPQRGAPAQITQMRLEAPIIAQDPSAIYLNDLFETYKKPTQEPQEPDYVRPIPPPPQPIVIAAPLPPVPQFLEPLSLTLTGVLMFNDDSKDRAIIVDNKSHQEMTYKVGDAVQDAQLIKIFANRVLLIRSNGQQEILYLTDEFENSQREKTEKKDWKAIVKQSSADSYIVDRQEFVETVGSLANFIDLFDLSSAYANGKSIGSKVGSIDRDSLASALGFRQNDIIEAVNDIGANDTSARLKIYNMVVQIADGQQLTVALKRSGSPHILTFIIGTINLPPQKMPSPAISQQTGSPEQTRFDRQAEQDLHNKQVELLKQKEKFAPTLQEIRLREKKNMIMHQKKRLNLRPPLVKDRS